MTLLYMIIFVKKNENKSNELSKNIDKDMKYPPSLRFVNVFTMINFKQTN
jgi:hypothetical protein